MQTGAPTHRILATVVAAALAPAIVRAQSVTTGDHIFSTRCARCHGAHGEGTEVNPTRLAGDLSVTQLAGVIAETMPEDDPGTVTADEALAVASYIHDAFYSPIAQARNKPARIELARLTVRQYRHSVADLIGSFDDRAWWGDERGLRGEYFSSREPKGGDDETKAERADAAVDFDFGTTTPLPELEDPRQFSIRWRGSLLAPETGRYEFIVRTEHAARLWVNNDRDEAATIDAWVKSGDETEYSAVVSLIGGRIYPIRLEFSKAKLGVDDSDEKKDEELPPPVPASIELAWRRPGSVDEVIPSRFLSTAGSPPQFVSTAPFPPDDRSYGWERGVAVSQAWDEATTSAAIEAAAYIAEHVDRLAGTSKDANDRPLKLREFCMLLAERAFRQPLNASQRQLYIERQFDEADNEDDALRRCALLVLKSPRFLFREVDDAADQHDVAARMAFALWNSLPDDELLDAARGDRLSTPEQVREHAWRMIGDMRSRSKLREFLLTWLHLDAGADLSKDPQAFPDFDARTIADARSSLELLLDDVLSSEAADFRRLLLADEVLVNDALARFYVGDDSTDEDAADVNASEYRPVKLDDGQRAGVLTHPYVMARFAYSSESSPIHRGVFLARGVLGRTLRPPPDAFVPLAPDLHPDLTTRERVTLQTQPGECMACHQIINPLGFALEQFDAVGRFRETERGKPVNAAASYQAPSGETVEITGARELAEYLAASPDCHAAFVEQLFHHLVQQPVAAYGPQTLENLTQRFVDGNFNIRQLAVEIVVATALAGRETNGTTQAAVTPI
jgi:hypothetical protein